MSELDLEYKEPEQVEQDLEYEDLEPVSASNKTTDNFLRLQAAFINSYNTGESVIESYRSLKSIDNPTIALGNAANAKAAIDNQELVDEFDNQLTNTPEVFPELAPTVLGLQEDNLQKAADPQRQFVDSVADPDVDEEVRAAAANSVKLYELLSQSVEELTTSDYVMDIAKTFIPFRALADDWSLFGSPVNNIDKLNNMIYNFKLLPYEEQQKIFPLIRDELFEGLGPLRGIEAVTKFIDPATEDELSDFSNWWRVFDVVDAASLGATLSVKIANNIAAFNIPKVLKKVDNESMAAESTVAAMVDDEAASVMNLSKETAAGNALPFDISIEDIGHTDKISAPTLKAIDEMFGKIDEVGESVLQGQGRLTYGILNNEERILAEDTILNRLSKAQHEDIRVVDRTENTTTFRYQARDEEGNITEEDFRLDLTLNDVGQWKQSELPALGELVTSPTVFARGLTRVDVDVAQQMDLQTAKVFKELTDLQKLAVAPLGNLLRPKNKKRLARVNEVLIEGDTYLDELNNKRGKVFDYDTLKGVYGLDDEQIQTYYGINRIYNHLWALRNNSKREEMVAFGFKGVNVGEQQTFGKAFDTAEAARQAMIDGKTVNIYDSVDEAQLSNVTLSTLEEMYELGKTLVRVDQPMRAGDKGKFTYILVNKEDVFELPAQVLPRKEGYIPRVAENGFWFVKEFGEELINGRVKSDAFLRTLRYFDNKAEAQKYIDQLVAKDLEKGLSIEEATAKYKALEDREQEIIATATGSFSHGSGGLYTGGRSEDGILFGLKGEEGTRLNAFEALSRNISNVSRLVPINQWRLGLEQRWINTARALGVPVQKFNELPDNIESTRAGAFLNKMAAQIRDWQGFPSREEQLYQGAVQRLHGWAAGKDSDKLKQLTGWLMDRDPIAAARATAFHSLLGWFNPAQLWVQAQGMAVAASIAAGDRLTEVTRKTTALTLLGSRGFDKTKRSQLAAKAAGVSMDELEELHSLWKKTGLEDSVLQTADHAAAMKGHGIAMDALKRAADRGLLFYRNGELLSRRMAFTTAVSEFKEKSKGAAVTDEALKGILTRTNNLLLNMTKANRAPWQKGLPSIPTQFFQVTAKALESATGANKNFTGNEIGKILLGQVALYGTAGIPLASMGIMYGAEALGFTQEDLDNNPTMVKSINDGFWGFVALGAFGVDAEVSKRGSLLRGVTEQLDNWIFSDKSTAEQLMGAFGSTGTRFWDSLMTNLRPINFSAATIDKLDVAKIATMPFLDTVSTWRNVEKAVFMQTMDELLTNRGDVSIKRDFSIRESIAKAIGFQLTEETIPYKLREYENAVKSVDARLADAILDRMNEVARRESLGLLDKDDDYLQKTQEFYAAVYASVKDPERQQRIRDAVWNRITSDSKSEMAITRYRERLAGKTVDELTTWHDILTGTSISTITREGEE